MGAAKIPQTILYGIKNCDTVKKARKWLEANDHEASFHDFREQGLDEKTLSHWVNTLGWETVFNKRSTSFRELPDSDKTQLDAAKAITLMLANPTLVKRPVLTDGTRVMVGFKAADYEAWFA
ncbi:ArsC family reductase [Shewanella sp. GXUN23E]|uniref:ArsC family reductase n=1 Tax=Shewanella sp. GXUN23E TaxID=3422498 RepID=UPI003D7EAD6B